MNDFSKDEKLPLWQRVLMLIGTGFQALTLYVFWGGKLVKYLPVINVINFLMFFAAGFYLSYLYRRKKLKFCHIGFVGFMDTVGFCAFIQLLEI